MGVGYWRYVGWGLVDSCYLERKDSWGLLCLVNLLTLHSFSIVLVLGLQRLLTYYQIPSGQGFFIILSHLSELSCLDFETGIILTKAEKSTI